ncbi:DUF4188 domain-containing protein [Ornithinimicrobium sp. LYQ92]|uniref:DUF4188 domain-containing protein n=1 Tax=Serinicoccus sp. LYQ92 TaxID=3378798 RepID=UPI0038526811
MRTQDFSRAPDIAQAGAMFAGGTRCAGPASWARHVRRHRTMVREMTRMSGYRAHHTSWQPPSTLGTLAWFDTMEDLVRFARTGTHPQLRDWVVDGTRDDTAGWIRVYTVEESGYTNGVWRAEDQQMRNIETFTPVGTETTGPPVRRVRRGRR